MNISIAKSNKRTWSRAFFPVAQSRGNSYRDKIGKFTEKRLLNVSWNFNLRCSEVIKQAAWDAALKTAADKGKASKKLALFQEMHASNFTWTVIHVYPITLTKWIVIPWIRKVLLVRYYISWFKILFKKKRIFNYHNFVIPVHINYYVLIISIKSVKDKNHEKRNFVSFHGI